MAKVPTVRERIVLSRAQIPPVAACRMIQGAGLAIALLCGITARGANEAEKVHANGVVVMPVGEGRWVLPSGATPQSDDFPTPDDDPPTSRAATPYAWLFQSANSVAMLFDHAGHSLWNSASAGIKMVAVQDRIDPSGALVFVGESNGFAALWRLTPPASLTRLSMPFSLRATSEGERMSLHPVADSKELFFLTDGLAQGRVTFVIQARPAGDGAAMPIPPADYLLAVPGTAKFLARPADEADHWDLYDAAHPQAPPQSVLSTSMLRTERLGPLPSWSEAAGAYLWLPPGESQAWALDAEGHGTRVPVPSGAADLRVSGALAWFRLPTESKIGALRFEAGQWHTLVPSLSLGPPIIAREDPRPESARRKMVDFLPLRGTNTAVAWKIGENPWLVDASSPTLHAQERPDIRVFAPWQTKPVAGNSWQILSTSSEGETTPTVVVHATANGAFEVVPRGGPITEALKQRRMQPAYDPLTGDMPASGWLEPSDNHELVAYHWNGSEPVKETETLSVLCTGREILDDTIWLPLEGGGLRTARFRIDSATGKPHIELAQPVLGNWTVKRILPLPSGRDALIEAEHGAEHMCAFVFTDPVINHAAVTFRDAPLPAPGGDKPAFVSLDEDREVKVSLDWEHRTSDTDSEWTIKLSAIDAHLNVTARGIQAGTSGDWAPPISLILTRRPDGPCTIEARYIDTTGTDFVLRWPQVTITPATHWYGNPRVMSFAACAAVWLLVFLCRIPSLPAAVQRFAPVALGGAVSAGGVPALAQYVDMPLFGGLMAVSVLALIGLGLVQPKMLRLYADVWPLDLALPSALRIPRLRRRVYADYAARLKRELDIQREAANNEHYASLPARLRQDKTERLLNDPVTEVLEKLTGDARTDVLVSAGGGTGKSAMLRAVVEAALARFEQHGGPLPIYLEGTGDLRQLAATELMGDRVSDKVLTTQLAQGDWFVVIDGLAEQGYIPEKWKQFRGADGVEATQVLAATRSDEHWEREFRSFGATPAALVTPQRLDDDTVRLFQKAYEPDPDRFLPPPVLDACRAADQGYLPILVRLALNVVRSGGDGQPTSLAKIYKGAIRQLAAKEIPAMRALCLATYWKDGRRVFRADIPDHEKTIRRLHEANVLVTASRSQADGILEKVRFFHDSMQSFITAEAALFEPGSSSTRTLACMAGAPIFLRSESTAGREGLPEIFRMAVAVLEDQQDGVSRLSHELTAWSQTYAGAFGADLVRAELPETIATRVPAGTDTQVVLLEAVRLLVAQEPAIAVRGLAALYGRLAPVVWPLIQGS